MRYGFLYPERFGGKAEAGFDNTAAFQAMFNLAAIRGNAPCVLSGMYEVHAPLLVPEGVKIMGATAGRDNIPTVGIRAAAPFSSTLTMTNYNSGTPETHDIAAVLISRGWVEGSSPAEGPIVMEDVFIGGGTILDDRNAPVHGVLLTNWPVRLTRVTVRNTTGFGVWMNSQLPDGSFSTFTGNPVFTNCRVGNCGFTSGGTALEYETQRGTFRYGAYHFGAFIGARNAGGESEPPRNTDGVINSCVQALQCAGNGMTVSAGGGWLINDLHTNGPGGYGIMFDRAFFTRILNSYLDGFCTTVPDGYGRRANVRVNTLLGINDEGEAQGLLLVSNNVMRLRTLPSTSETAYYVSVSASGNPACRFVAVGNATARQKDVTDDVKGFQITGSGADPQLHVTLVGNDLSDVPASDTFNTFGDAVVSVRQSGNSWQYQAARPTSGYWPEGTTVFASDVSDASLLGWVRTERGGNPGALNWRPMESFIVRTAANGATTPDVTHANMVILNNSAATSITNFTNALEGQRLTVMSLTVHSTLVQGANLKMRSGADVTLGAEAALTLVRRGTRWYEA